MFVKFVCFLFDCIVDNRMGYVKRVFSLDVDQILLQDKHVITRRNTGIRQKD